MAQPPCPDAPTEDAAKDPAEDANFFFPEFAPVPMQRRRANGWTPRHQRLFIAMLAETGSVSTAAQCVGL